MVVFPGVVSCDCIREAFAHMMLFPLDTYGTPLPLFATKAILCIPAEGEKQMDRLVASPGLPGTTWKALTYSSKSGDMVFTRDQPSIDDVEIMNR